MAASHLKFFVKGPGDSCTESSSSFQCARILLPSFNLWQVVVVVVVVFFFQQLFATLI